MAEKKRRVPVTAYGCWAYARLREMNMTLEELGKRIGVPPNNLGDYFRGLRRGREYSAKIEQVLGEPPAEIKSLPDAKAG